MTTPNSPRLISLRWSSEFGDVPTTIVDPAGTAVAAVATAGETLRDAHGALKLAERERAISTSAAAGARDAARTAAAEAGREGKKGGSKKLRARVSSLRDAAEEAELDHVAAIASMSVAASEYAAVVQHYRPALHAEAVDALDAAILSLTTAQLMARKARNAVTGALTVIGALQGVENGGGLGERPLSSGRLGFAHGHADEAIELLSAAVAAAVEQLDRAKAEEKVRLAAVPVVDPKTGEERDPREIPYTDEDDDEQEGDGDAEGTEED